MLNLGCGNRTHEAWINIDYSRTARLKGLWFVQPFVSICLPQGYLNHDLRHGIPFADGTVDVVYSSHLLEHLEHGYALAFIQECYRVLKPGGVVRIVVPDLEKVVTYYLAALSAVRTGEANAQERHEWATIWLLDQMVRTEQGGEMAKWLRAHCDSPVVQEMGGICAEIAEGDARPHGLKATLMQLVQPRNPASTGELHRWMYDEISLAQLFEQVGFQDIQRMSHLSSRIPNWTSYELDNNSDGSLYQPASLFMEAVK